MIGLNILAHELSRCEPRRTMCAARTANTLNEHELRRLWGKSLSGQQVKTSGMKHPLSLN